MSKEEIDAFLAEELGSWAANTSALLRQRIKSAKLVLSEELYNSIENQVLKGTGETLASVKFAFNSYGRQREMKKLFYSKMPPVEEIEQFIYKTGLSKFKYVPGSPGKIPSEDRDVKRIAWAIAKSRLKDDWGQYKPQKWFAKSFYSQINVLIGGLLEGYQDFAARAITEPLKG